MVSDSYYIKRYEVLSLSEKGIHGYIKWKELSSIYDVV